eukprot:1159334-Pelagomonas_calceolata.AAC.4
MGRRHGCATVDNSGGSKPTVYHTQGQRRFASKKTKLHDQAKQYREGSPCSQQKDCRGKMSPRKSSTERIPGCAE